MTPESPRPDLFWRDAGLAIEYDSAEFHAKAGNDKVNEDVERANALRAAGLRVLEVTPGLALEASKVDILAGQTASLLGTSLQPVDEERLFRRRELHALLLRG